MEGMDIFSETNQLDFEWLEVKVTKGQQVKIVFMRLTPFKIVQ